MSEDKVSIAIADYGTGNLFSLKKAMRYLGAEVLSTEDPELIKKSDGLVLPGVGSFKTAMCGIKVRGLDSVIKEFSLADKPVLGICLGAQIMMTKGYEFGECEGLDLVKGNVMRFPRVDSRFKVPHIGWNKIFSNTVLSWEQTILDEVLENSFVYFVHSYVLEPEDKGNALSSTSYGNLEFCSVIKSGNTYGVQFHPEKSGEVGLLILKNFIDIARIWKKKF
jgi:glutamine amidotransferase